MGWGKELGQVVVIVAGGSEMAKAKESAKKSLTTVRHARTNAKLLGRYIVADPKICHGKPTFRGTRIMVWQVLEMVSDGMAWESISEQWGGSISKEAIGEAVQLASKSFIKHANEHALTPLAA